MHLNHVVSTLEPVNQWKNILETAKQTSSLLNDGYQIFCLALEKQTNTDIWYQEWAHCFKGSRGLEISEQVVGRILGGCGNVSRWTPRTMWRESEGWVWLKLRRTYIVLIEKGTLKPRSRCFRWDWVLYWKLDRRPCMFLSGEVSVCNFHDP